MSHTHSSRSESASLPEGVDFGPFRLTLLPLRLWRGQKAVPLQPRPLAVLRYFVEHPETVVSNEDLRRAVWGRTVVSSTTVQVCVREVRRALGDETSTPCYIETVGREGYRFIAPLTATQPMVSGQRSVVSEDKTEVAKSQQLALDNDNRLLATRLVGREAELAQLRTFLDKALQGERQLVFITGEAGIGKTTLIDAFLQSFAPEQELSSKLKVQSHQNQTLDASLWISRGQCLEYSGEGEAYLPILEAVGQLCQQPDSTDFLVALRRYAPTWLLHLPGVVEPAERELLQRQGAGATQGQMLREMAEALEAVSAVRGVVLVFEDLHVSDPSTVELLVYLAQRRARARLLIIGSYRPVNVILSEHPLRGRVQELVARGYGQAVVLELWTEAEVATYLRRRLGAATLPAFLARWVFERTDGNALFVVHMVEYLLEQQRLTLEEGSWLLSGDLTSAVVPGTLQHLILAQFHSLASEQQQVLEAASVVGAVFTAASVAAALQCLPEAVEESCDRLVQRGQFLKELGLATWPDGSASGQYGFSHVLYPEVLYQQLSAGRRMRMHRAIGVREEIGYGERSCERAAELARHFAQGRDPAQAVRYLVQAGQQALQWSAHVEALSHFNQGLTLLADLPETLQRKQQELWLQTGLGIAQMITKGFAAPEVEQAFLRARVLCHQVGDAPELYLVVAGLWVFYQIRGELRTARQLAEQLLRLAHDAGDPALLAIAHANMQASLYLQGELVAARAYGEQALTQFTIAPSVPLLFSYGPSPIVHTYNLAAAVLHALGYPDQSRRQSRAALALAQELGQVLNLAGTLNYIANMHGAYGEWALMQTHAAELMALASTHNLPFWWAQGICTHGIALTQQGNTAEGIEQIQQGLVVYRAAGSTVGVARILGWLAEAYGQAGQIEEGWQALAEAFTLTKRNEERIWEAELFRRQGELLLQQVELETERTGDRGKIFSSPDCFPPPSSPEECFLKAIAIARQQQAKAYELRATLSLARLWHCQGRQHEAHTMLSAIYHWFTEGFDTKDLQEAKALLEICGH